MKRFFTLFFTLVLILSFCSCGEMPKENEQKNIEIKDDVEQKKGEEKKPKEEQKPEEEKPEEKTLPEVLVSTHIEKTKATVDTQNTGCEFSDHRILVPGIDVQSDVAKMLNERIKSYCQPAVDALETDTEGEHIYLYWYVAGEIDGYVGIVQRLIDEVQYGDTTIDYKFTYYDANEDKEIMFDEYLSAVGYSKNDLINKITEHYTEFDFSVPDFEEILGAAIGDGFYFIAYSANENGKIVYDDTYISRGQDD